MGTVHIGHREAELVVRELLFEAALLPGVAAAQKSRALDVYKELNAQLLRGTDPERVVELDVSVDAEDAIARYLHG